MVEVVTTVFDTHSRNKYTRLRDVLVGSMSENMPDATLTVLELPRVGEKEGVHQGFVNNHYKLRAQLDYVGTITHPTILIDIDTMVLKPLESAFESEFDVGVTKRNHKRLPLNGGVIFLHPTEGAQKWLHDMRSADERLEAGDPEICAFMERYGGVNQSAMGYLLETHSVEDVRYKWFDGRIWNACDRADWKAVSKKTRVIHIKSQLRDGFFMPEICELDHRDIVQRAMRYERIGAKIGGVNVRIER